MFVSVTVCKITHGLLQSGCKLYATVLYLQHNYRLTT